MPGQGHFSETFLYRTDIMNDTQQPQFTRYFASPHDPVRLFYIMSDFKVFMMQSYSLTESSVSRLMAIILPIYNDRYIVVA